jgi:hypothetical protein
MSNVENKNRVFCLSVADHQQASPPERAQWTTVGAISAVAFAAAALLVALTLRLHSHFARKLQVISYMFYSSCI